MRESRVERYLVRRVRELGGVALKFTSPGTSGVPDRLVVLRDVDAAGHTYLVEVKSPTGRLRKLQTHIHGLLRKAGAEVVVLKSVDEVDDWLNSLRPA